MWLGILILYVIVKLLISSSGRTNNKSGKLSNTEKYIIFESVRKK